MTKDLDALAAEIEAGLEGVTPGPWYECAQPWFGFGNTGVMAKSPDPHVCLWVADTDIDESCNEDHPIDPETRHANAAHIAFCSPDNMRALLAERKQMKAALEEAKDFEFKRGYLIACCNVMNLHGDVVAAYDALIQVKFSTDEIRRMDLTEYDATALAEICNERNGIPSIAAALTQDGEG